MTAMISNRWNVQSASLYFALIVVGGAKPAAKAGYAKNAGNIQKEKRTGRMNVESAVFVSFLCRIKDVSLTALMSSQLIWHWIRLNANLRRVLKRAVRILSVCFATEPILERTTRRYWSHCTDTRGMTGLITTTGLIIRVIAPFVRNTESTAMNRTK